MFLKDVAEDGDMDLDTVPQEELDNLDKKLGALVGQLISMKVNKRLEKKKMLAIQTANMHFRIRLA